MYDKFKRFRKKVSEKCGAILQIGYNIYILKLPTHKSIFAGEYTVVPKKII